MIGFKAFKFDGRRTAGKALDTAIDNTPAAVWADDVAVISRGKLGALHVHSTWAQDDDNVVGGIGWGALTGGLIGALAGPSGALAGAIGGSSVAGLVGLGVDLAISDPVLEEFAEGLADDTSALVLVADEPTLVEFASGLDFVDAEVIETELSEADVNALRKALKS
jgi:uncharacterized membrane protein